MKIILMLALASISLWDAFTTLIGTNQILGNESGQIIISVVFAVIILGFMVGTAFIFDEGGLLGGILKLCWFLALVYDFYTSYIGNLRYIMGGSANEEQKIILVGITILVSASPLLLSLIWKKYF